MKKTFKYPNEFPYESFVQKAIERYYIDCNYVINVDGQVDLIAQNEDEVWYVEAKGVTSSIGLDFNTCIGQIVKSMISAKRKYAIAIPKHYKYKKQCELLSQYFRKLTELHILLVDCDGKVEIIAPNQEVSDFVF